MPPGRETEGHFLDQPGWDEPLGRTAGTNGL